MKIEYGRLSRRARLERHQHRDHLEPPADGRSDDASDRRDEDAAARRDRRDLRLRDAGRPRRRPARPGDRRPQRADPPDDVVRLRRRRPRGRPVQPPDLRLHLLAHHQPDRGRARGAGRRARGRSGRGRGSLRTRGPAARLLHAPRAGRPRRRRAPALRRVADPVPPHVRPARLARPPSSTRRTRRRSRARSASGPRPSSSSRSPIRAASSSISRRWPRSRTRRRSRSSSTTRSRRPTCAGRSSGAPTSSSTR